MTSVSSPLKWEIPQPTRSGRKKSLFDTLDYVCPLEARRMPKCIHPTFDIIIIIVWSWPTDASARDSWLERSIFSVRLVTATKICCPRNTLRAHFLSATSCHKPITAKYPRSTGSTRVDTSQPRLASSWLVTRQNYPQWSNGPVSLFCHF